MPAPPAGFLPHGEQHRKVLSGFFACSYPVYVLKTWIGKDQAGFTNHRVKRLIEKYSRVAIFISQYGSALESGSKWIIFSASLLVN
jgi:hypothetical protein